MTKISKTYLCFVLIWISLMEQVTLLSQHRIWSKGYISPNTLN